MARYHPLLVALHWLLAIMIILALVMGHFVLAETPNTDPEKLFSLKMHMGMGIAILVLMLARLGVRHSKPRPAAADIGNPALNKLGSLTHILLYVAVIFTALSGIGISFLAGLPDIVFFGSGAPLPANFDDLLPRFVHGIISKLLAVLIIAHVGAFFYHQFVRKDGLFARMWFGSK
ncbi:MAG: cytochrome b/b6 domain-containing protein [Rhizobiaceae bacterium]